MIDRAIIAPPREPRGRFGRKITVRLPLPDPATGNTDEQVLATLGVMRGLVRDAPRWNAIQRLAQSPYPVYQICAAVTFRRDPRTAEAIRHPELLARHIEQGGKPVGDCDDRATLGAAILHARGQTPVFIVMSRRPGANFEHVYFGEMIEPGQPVSVANTIPYDPQERTPPGSWTPPAPQGGRVWIVPAT